MLPRSRKRKIGQYHLEHGQIPRGPLGLMSGKVRHLMSCGSSVFVVAAAVLGGGLVAQNPAPAGQRSGFRSGVDVVALNVTVTDGAQHFVSDHGRQLPRVRGRRPHKSHSFRGRDYSRSPAVTARAWTTSCRCAGSGGRLRAALGRRRRVGHRLDSRVNVLQVYERRERRGARVLRPEPADRRRCTTPSISP